MSSQSVTNPVTANRSYPKTHPLHRGKDDAARIAQTFDMVDADIAELGGRAGALEERAGQVEDRADDLETRTESLEGRADDLESGKAAKDLSNVDNPTLKAKAAAAGVGNPLVRMPTITAPAASATNVSRRPTVTTSAYGSVYGVAARAIQYQWTTGTFADPTFSDPFLVEASPATSFTLPLLLPSTTYYIRVRHQDADLVYSDWSPVVSFTTAATTTAAPTFTGFTPAQNATGVQSGPTLQTSAFALTDAASGTDTHQATDWEIWTGPNGTGTRKWSSLNDTTNKTTISPTKGVLEVSTTYYLRARHLGSVFGWGAWSADRKFTMASYFGLPVLMEMWAGGGGSARNNYGGPSGFTTYTEYFLSGTVLTVMVGDGGNGDSNSSGGGGYSGVFVGEPTQANALAIAGAGGGGNTNVGGYGGGLTGGSGRAAFNGTQGGTQTAGGSGNGVSGSALQGGSGSGGALGGWPGGGRGAGCGTDCGSGGGAGWFGGGCSGAYSGSEGAGGGGSGYVKDSTKGSTTAGLDGTRTPAQSTHPENNGAGYAGASNGKGSAGRVVITVNGQVYRFGFTGAPQYFTVP